jgi:protocatechuate 3,4-dioxygenase beta subunit
MKTRLWILFFIGITPFSLFCQAQQWGKKIKTLSAQLTAHHTRTVYDSLHFLVAEHYLQLTPQERDDIRHLLEQQTQGSFEKLNTNQEKGTKITIKGRVLDAHQKPIPRARLSIFHADAKGYYAPTDSVLKKMNEADPRLFGFLTTDAAGNYSFQTVRPASYPTKYNGRFIPQHIHINCTAKGYKALNIQMAFEDDPAMQDTYWQKWAKQQNYPVVKLHYDKDDRLYGECDLILIP